MLYDLRIIPNSFILFILLGSCIPVNSVFRGKPDSKDSHRFKNVEIKADSCFYFSNSKEFNVLKINDWTSDVPVFKPIIEVLKEHPVRAFVLIQNDTIKFEYYKEGFNKQSLHPSYSIAKSFISCLIGIALEEGLIKSVRQKVIDFIPEIAHKEKSDLLTIQHLLNHTSGIKYSLINDAQIYYGRDIIGQLNNIQFEISPGIKQQYLNINSQLLGLILTRCTKKSLSEFSKEKLWGPINMCNDGLWSTDVKHVEKSFCCLSATALDYAKFGRLYLKKGIWEGRRVFSESWYNESIRRDTTEGSSYNYNYSWHIGLREYEDYMAIGLYKQHIYISPKKNTVIVLLNDRENKLLAERVNWWNVFRQIVDQL